MNTVGTYAIETTTTRSFEDALARTIELLAGQGFGIVTEIDLQATLKKKLDVDVRPYRILGACHPEYAKRATAAAPHVGVFLPCNVVVWDDGTHRTVAAMEPKVMAQVIEHPELRVIAEEVSAKIHAVVRAID